MDPRSVDALETVDRNARQLLGLINDILDMSKIQANHTTLDENVFDSVAELRAVLVQAEPLLDGKQIELVTRLPNAAVTVQADRVKFGQIVLNLVSNAIKYTDSGTVEVVASIQSSGDEAVAPTLRVAVHDTGIGIKKDDQAKLFERFSQLDGAANRRAGGTGLGLFITATYVDMHGGTLDVESEWGEGSTFTAELPIVMSESVDETQTALA